MANQSQWIFSRLQENSWNKELVYSLSLYEQFKQEFQSELSLESYKRIVRKVCSISIFAKDIESIKEIDSKKILLSIQKFISENKRKITNSDLSQIAKDNDIKLEDIFKIPDLKKVLDASYRLEMLHLDDKININRLKDEISILRIENKRLIKSQNSIDKILDILQEIIVDYDPFTPPKLQLNKNDIHKYEGVVQLSDWHFDEKVSLMQMHGINEYTIQIAKDRIDTVFSKIVLNIKKFNLNTIHLLFLGDLISGRLHDLAENNELGIIKSILMLADYTAQQIQNLSKHIKNIHVIGICGNHSRLDKKPVFKNKQFLNFEYLLYEFIKRSTTKIVQSFIIPESAFFVQDILNKKMLSFHGDIINGGTGLNSVPGNLSRDVSLLSGTLTQLIEDNIDIVNIGHFHVPNFGHAFSGAQIITNGSLIGGNEFSINAIKKSHRPGQMFYIVDEESNAVKYLDYMEV